MIYRADVDGLRTVAVIPVLIFHAGLGLSGGFVGVDVFFVISGFLITGLLLGEMEERRFSLLGFYERRARRIFPALFAMIAVTSLAAVVIMVPADLASYGKSVAATTMFLANAWFYTQQGYFTEAAELKPLLHAWSLGVEEQFYVVFPLLLWLGIRIFRAIGAAVLIAIVGIISLAMAQLALSSNSAAAFYLPQYRAWELFLGSLLAIASARGWLKGLGRHSWLNKSLSVLGLALILYAVIGFGPETPFPGLSALFPCLGTALLIATGEQGTTPIRTLLELPVMTFVGKLSYSLYLWHWPFIAFTYYATAQLSVFSGLMCLAASGAAAYLSWRYVEQPVRDRKRVSRSAVMGWSAAVMVAFVALGLALFRLDGLPDRLPQEMNALADYRNHIHDRRECHFVTPERARSGDVCVRGAINTTPSFVLVGDSHADAFSPALFAAATDLGISGYQYTDAGFRPLKGVSQRGDASFESDVAAFIDFVLERPNLRTIYLTLYWQHQMTGYTYRHRGTIWVDKDYNGEGTAYNRIATLNGLRRLAEALPGRRIVILDDVPTGDALHMPTQLRVQRFGLKPTDEMGLPKTESDEQRATYEPDLRRLASSTDRIAYRPVFVSLCDAVRCPLFDGDTLLFRDGDHLSKEGAMKLKGAARRMLEDEGV
ncbi:acyltransferase family protein [Qipengyuania sp.]|uniref:acyltransferase family protein n=1 Tax=Qipengyuania sp. TaxID=2004515 RepID=UPI003514083B